MVPRLGSVDCMDWGVKGWVGVKCDKEDQGWW